MDLYDVMTTTSTTRAFLPDAVDDAVLYKVLDHARYAPQGGNRQGHRVIVIRDPQMRRTLRDLYKAPWDAYTAAHFPPPDQVAPKYRRQRELIEGRFVARMDEIPVHLLVAVNLKALEITDKDLDRPSVVGGGSVYPFVQNILLACRHEGLGAALTTLVITAEPQLRPLLHLPDDYALAAHILVGWPDPEYLTTKLRRRPVERFATHETFDGIPLSSEDSAS